MGLAAALVVAVLRSLTLLYDVMTFPVYLVIQKPWRRLREHMETKAQAVSVTEEGITFRATTPISPIHIEMENKGIDTMDKMFSYAVKRNGTKRCLGTRELLAEEEEMQKNGKMFKKFAMGDYVWRSYNAVDNIADNFGKGLRELGIQPKDRISIFAETRAEWLIAAIGAFKQNLTIVTLYSTLGDDAISHGLNETEVDLLITSHELLPKFKTILHNTPFVKKIIYMEDPLKQTETTGFREDVKIQSFCDIVAKGSKSKMGVSPPTPEDVAIIMYTSGSTGTPKGVLLSHANIVLAMMAFCDALGTVYDKDVYIGYLPLAHVLELMCEAVSFLSGIPIGYSSPLTMTDNSSKIKRGCKGDTSILRPTIMTTVPLIIERIYKGIQEKVSESGEIGKGVFKFFYDYKLKWYYRGFKTPIVDKVVFKKLRHLVGGKVRIIACGGAPLCADTQEFIRNCLCAPVVQGYGLTETAACTTITIQADMSTGRAGVPFGCCDVRLVNWEEGNYRIDDTPFPRGEIIIGGHNVALGYYKLPEQTAQDFFEEDGRRWFRSGDIGEIQGDGVIRIVDRKKDLVKLQAGEYISLGKVESELKRCALIDNICVYGDSKKSYCVALIVPTQKQLTALATKIGKGNLSFQEMCDDREVEKAALKELQAHGSKTNLIKFEIPAAVKLCSEIWTPDMGLVTAAFKLKRKNIQDHYQSDINRMYA